MSQDLIRAAGVMLWRDHEIAVVHRPRYDDWSLPKGKLEHAETPPAAAVREAGEETGYPARLVSYLDQIRYQVDEIPKAVDFFSAAVAGEPAALQHEVDKLRWVTPTRAEGLLSYQQERDLVHRFQFSPEKTNTVALVRHAKAGSREKWAGDDAERPLNQAGWRQALALRDLLQLWRPTKIFAAPLVRCVQTMRPLAEACQLPVLPEPALSEQNYTRDWRFGISRLTQIALREGMSVVCSQGGVIPDIVSRLSPTGNIDAAAPRAGKASVWLLSFFTDKETNASDKLRFSSAYYLPAR